MSPRKFFLLTLALLTGALAFADLKVTSLVGFGSASTGLTAETVTWQARVISAGGTFGASSVVNANNLSRALAASSFNAKVVYILPLFGSNLAAARVPLRDSLGVGIATNHNFVDGDFSESTGLQGNGTTKYLDSLIKASQLGTSNSGGLGWFENNFGSFSNVEPIGSYSGDGTNRFVLDLRTTLRAFRWGNAGNGAGDSTSAANADYYGQRNGASSRELFLNGSSVATQTSSDSTAGAGDVTIYICGVNDGSASAWGGRCVVAYMTNGTLSSGDVTALHTLLNTYVKTAAGR